MHASTHNFSCACDPSCGKVRLISQDTVLVLKNTTSPLHCILELLTIKHRIKNKIENPKPTITWSIYTKE